jgi:DNA polymerase III subunit gamma/tau
MAYTVLARRYRSQTFDEVVGQEAVARTLQNAIEQDRVAHAYLFVGTRGVGKTSMARIFAKALAGGTPEADKAIMSGQDTDVIEIDAASNSGVDNARELIANSIYRPLRGKAKVYIIDEVHMLSTQAFNALLKTMEEPPAHVKFILCTTEAHKVPATIQSRCQRFDFRNLSSAEIAAHLKAVCEQEKVKAEPELLHAVARLAAGSMRDSLSLMDRLIAAVPQGKTVTVSVLESLLGLPERGVIGELLAAVAASDPATALARADALIAKGVGIDQLLDSVIQRVRELMLVRVCGSDTELVDLSPAARQETAALADQFDPPSLVHMIALCESVQRAGRTSLAPRAILDALVVRLAMTDKIADLTALVAGGGAGPRASAAPSRAPSGAGAGVPSKKA